MTNVSSFIFGAVIAAVSISSPALAQHASKSAQSISVHHNKHFRMSSRQSDLPTAVAAPRSVYDPGAPYVYVPGMASNMGH
jgi:hypothetical protein